MQRCPLCRAVLGDGDTCRRCKADLTTVRRVIRDSQALAGAAMHCLTQGNTTAARRLVRRALDLHATPETQALWRLVSE